MGVQRPITVSSRCRPTPAGPRRTGSAVTPTGRTSRLPAVATTAYPGQHRGCRARHRPRSRRTGWRRAGRHELPDAHAARAAGTWAGTSPPKNKVTSRPSEPRPAAAFGRGATAAISRPSANIDAVPITNVPANSQRVPRQFDAEDRDRDRDHERHPEHGGGGVERSCACSTTTGRTGVIESRRRIAFLPVGDQAGGHRLQGEEGETSASSDGVKTVRKVWPPKAGDGSRSAGTAPSREQHAGRPAGAWRAGQVPGCAARRNSADLGCGQRGRRSLRWTRSILNDLWDDHWGAGRSGRRTRRRGWPARPAGSAATIRRRASSEVTALSSSPPPGDLDRRPVARTESTSGRACSTASSIGADGRNRIRCSPASPATRPAGVSIATTRPAVDDRDPVAEPLGLLHEVRDQQHRDALVADLLDQLPRRRGGPAGRGRWSARRGSRPAGCPTRASAIDSRCFWPPDSLPNAVSRLAASPQRSMSSPESAGSRRTRRTARRPRATRSRSGSSPPAAGRRAR